MHALDGDLAELVVFSGTLDEQRADVERVLMEKYGLK